MIKRSMHRLGFLFSMALLALLMLPTMQWMHPVVPEKNLYGYTDDIVSKPSQYLKGFFDKSLQHWLEAYFNVHLGFRGHIIRTFNEINFRLFRESDNRVLKIVSTKKHGLYSELSIHSLNNEILYRTTLEKKYQAEAQKLLQVQQILAKQGKYFLVVIASSKAYIYPDGLGKRYLIGGSKRVFDKAASFGHILQMNGIHVIDSGPLLRNLAQTSGVITHPNSGLHWGYYASCQIAQRMFQKIQQEQFPLIRTFSCGAPHNAKPDMNDVDVDGYLMLNIWSPAGLLKPATYANVSFDNNPDVWRPNIVMIGDSFSDHIFNALKKANTYSQIIRSNYFKTRSIDDLLNSKNNREDTHAVDVIQANVLADISHSSIIILEMVDYNVFRLGYGFSDYFLSHQN